MIGILGELTSEYRTFNLNKINIEDEGMEDLEKFNQMYKIDDSKCSLFDEIKQVHNFNPLFMINNGSKVSLEDGTYVENNGALKSNYIFRIDLYLKRVIKCMTKPKIKSLILELGSMSSNNFLILTKIKSVKSNWSKEKLVDMAVDIILTIINKDE